MADDTGTQVATSPNAGLRALAGNVKIGSNGLAPVNLAELMDFAQLMAKAGPMVGKTFRDNPGACLGIAMQAMQWGMNPFAVSQKAYTTGDNIGYEGQLVIAVINAHAPIVARLKPTYSGEGATRKCTISATLKGETEPAIYESPEVGEITVKNSPLWKSDPDQQLFYYSSRMWARRYCPEVIMGVYDIDELAAAEPMTVASNVPLVDEYDQRPRKEIATEQAEVGEGGFIGGELATLLTAHLSAQFDACATPEEADKVVASFKRKYRSKSHRVRASDNYALGVEEMRERAIMRLRGADGMIEKLQSFRDMTDMEEWWARETTGIALAQLPEEQQARVTAEYEDLQEGFAREMDQELMAARIASGQVEK
jgi:hypothetical protein